MVQARQDQVDAETQANLAGLVVPAMHKHSNKHKLSVNERAVVEENNRRIEAQRLQAESATSS
ncbi:MAG: hypothetical protein AB8U53_02875 [Rickettsia aeschlimannii]